MTAGEPSQDATYIKTIMELTKVKEIVAQILENDVRAKNDDKWLCYRVFQGIAEQNGKKIFIPFELFTKFCSFESISRVRRKLNEQGKYLPTDPEVIRQRAKRRVAVRDWSLVDKEK